MQREKESNNKLDNEQANQKLEAAQYTHKRSLIFSSYQGGFVCSVCVGMEP